MYNKQLKEDIFNKAKEFGPRVRIVSIITDAPIEPDEKLEEELCIHCKKCIRLCPANCLEDKGAHPYEMDRIKCTEHHVELVKQHHWPCGYCATFCPVGEDMKMYRGVEVVSKAGIEHCQKYGS